MKFRASILLVDDRQHKRVMYRAILDDVGQNFVVAASSDDAMKQIAKQDFAVILLDVDTPGIDGLETATLIRARQLSTNVPIIFITAAPWSDERTAQAYALGAVDFLISPIIPEILRSKVKVFVDLYLFSKHARRQVTQRIALVAARNACGDAERENRRFAYLAGASVALSRSLNVSATARELVGLAVPYLADVAAVTLADRNADHVRTEMAWVSGAHPGPHREALPGLQPGWWREGIERVLTSGIAESHIERGAPVPEHGIGKTFTREILDLSRGPRIGLLMLLPLTARGHVVGVLSLGRGPAQRKFGLEQFSLASDLAERAAIALDNALLYSEARGQDRRELEVSRPGRTAAPSGD